MFDHAGTERLIEARRSAGDLGAVSTGAVIDLQLCAAFIFRFALDEARTARSICPGHQRTARPGQGPGDRAACSSGRSTRSAAKAQTWNDSSRSPTRLRPVILRSRAAPGLAAGECSGCWTTTGLAPLRTLATASPSWTRCRSRGRRATGACGHCCWPPRRPARAGGDRAGTPLGLTVNRANRGMLGYAEAILAGRDGDRQRATELARAADGELVHYPVWADLGGCARRSPRWLMAGGSPSGGLRPGPSVSLPRASTRWPSAAAGCSTGRARAAGPGSASPTAKPMCSGWWPRAWPTRRSQRGCMSRPAPSRSMSRACCARPPRGRGPSWSLSRAPRPAGPDRTGAWAETRRPDRRPGT